MDKKTGVFFSFFVLEGAKPFPPFPFPLELSSFVSSGTFTKAFPLCSSGLENVL